MAENKIKNPIKVERETFETPFLSNSTCFSVIGKTAVTRNSDIGANMLFIIIPY